MLKCKKCGKEFANQQTCPYCETVAITDIEDILTKNPAESIWPAEYLGGHVMYTEKRDVRLQLLTNEVSINELDLHIPYASIKEVKNIDESHMKLLRIVAFGIYGALWKKKERYLCIIYNDGIQDQNPVFKLDNLEICQRIIYQRVAQAKTK